jgi:hypothetical protein
MFKIGKKNLNVCEKNRKIKESDGRRKKEKKNCESNIYKN